MLIIIFFCVSTEGPTSHFIHDTVVDDSPASRRKNGKFLYLSDVKPKDLVPSSFTELFQIFTFSFRAKWHKEILHSIGRVAATEEEHERRRR